MIFMNSTKKAANVSEGILAEQNGETFSLRGGLFESSGRRDWARFLLSRISAKDSSQSECIVALLRLVENIDLLSKSLFREDYSELIDLLAPLLEEVGASARTAATLLPADTSVDTDLVDGKFVQRIVVSPRTDAKKQQVVEFGELELAPGRQYLVTSEYDKTGRSNDSIELYDLDTGSILDSMKLGIGFNRHATSIIDVTGAKKSVRLGFRFINRSSENDLYWYQSKLSGLPSLDDQSALVASLIEELKNRHKGPETSIFFPITGEPMTMTDADRLNGLRNKFAGERIFIMGNGPSLNKTPLDKLENEFVFGLNRISLLFDRVSWRPTFFTAFDVRVVPDNSDEFSNLDIEYKFFSARYKKLLGEKPNHYWHHTKGFYDGFESCFEPTVPFTGFGGGGTIAIIAIELAFFMGFKEIYLIGTDVSYSVPKTVIQSGKDVFGDGVKLNLESTKDDDQNHFDPRYFGAGKKWHNPNVRDMKIGFSRAASYIEQRGGRLLNATIGGELDQVQRVEFDSLF